MIHYYTVEHRSHVGERGWPKHILLPAYYDLFSGVGRRRFWRENFSSRPEYTPTWRRWGIAVREAFRDTIQRRLRRERHNR